MKKLVFLGLASCCMASVIAQNDTTGVRNRRGNMILPEKHDIALGFNTVPILDVLLKSFNLNTPAATSSNMVQYTSAANNQITGKYFLDPKTAIRVRLGINTLSGSITSRVQDAPAMQAALMGTADDIAAASLLRVEDKYTFKKNNLLLSIGLEKRRGYRRLQGYYGAEIGFGNEGANSKTTYGNAFSDQREVYYTNFSSMSTVTVNPATGSRIARNTETRYRGGIRIGLRGFIGIEYFVFAKISIAAEYGWGYSVTTRRAGTSKQEVYFNGQNGPGVVNEDVKSDSREVTKGFAVDNNSGSAFSINNTVGGNTALNGGAGALTILFHF
jgi:hypothetical protein